MNSDPKQTAQKAMNAAEGSYCSDGIRRLSKLQAELQGLYLRNLSIHRSLAERLSKPEVQLLVCLLLINLCSPAAARDPSKSEIQVLKFRFFIASFEWHLAMSPVTSQTS